MEYEKLIKERYSTRSFSSKEVSQEKLDKILQAGLLAPTAKNNQPQKIYILKSATALAKIRKLTPCTYNAPLVLLVCYDENKCFKNTKSLEFSGVEDASIVCTHIMLSASNEGLGTCWVNLYDSREIAKEFNLPNNIKVVCLLDVGYPEKDDKPGPMHSISKTKEEIYEEL